MIPKQTIYIELVVEIPKNAVELTHQEDCSIPTNYLKVTEYEKRFISIDYIPGSPETTREAVINVILKAYKRKHKVVSYTVFDEQKGVEK